MPENAIEALTTPTLTMEDIEALGVLAGMHVLGMADHPTTAERQTAVLDLGLEAIARTSTPVVVPAEVDDAV